MNLGSKILLLPSILLLIGAVIGTSATKAYAEGPFDNEINRDIDVKHTNSCDESEDGDNKAICRDDSSVTGTSDTGPGTGTGTLIVTKKLACVSATCDASEPDDFTILVTGDVKSSPNPFPGSATGTEVTLGPGSYSVSEPTFPFPGISAMFSSDCSGTISAGETKNCLVNNFED
jgi:hypothetical protein